MGAPVAENSVNLTRLPDPGRRRSLTRLAGPGTAYARRPPATGLYLETGYATDEFVPAPETMHWERLSEGMDGADTTLGVVGKLAAEKLTGAGLIGDEHFSQALEALDPARRVRVLMGAGSGDPLPLFEGYPAHATMQWTRSDQSYTCGCVSTADEALDADPRAMVLGRHLRRRPESIAAWDPANPDLIVVDALPLAYNADGRPNRTPEPLDIQVGTVTYPVYLHTEDDGDGAQYWNYAAALTNLLVLHVLRTGLSVSVSEALRDLAVLQSVGHAASSPDPYERRLTARAAPTSCRAMTVKEALSLLCHAAGIHFHLPIRHDRATGTPAYWLRLAAVPRNDAEETATPLRFCISPRAHDLPRLAPLTDTAADAADDVAEDNRAAFDAVITHDHRLVTHPIFYGDVRRHEVTLLLRPGWKPAAQLDNIAAGGAFESAMVFWEAQFDPADEFDPDTGKPHSTYHQQHPDFHMVRDVGRLWIFPDTDRYPGNVYARTNGASPGFDAALYSPFLTGTQGSPALVYHDDLIGGGIPLLNAVKWAMRPRPFLNTIGRDGPTDERSPIVRLLFNHADPYTALLQPESAWVRYRGTIRFDAKRGALWIDEDNLRHSPALAADPNDTDPLTYLEAYLRGTLQVSVTCTIEGDERLAYEPVPPLPPMPRHRGQVIDAADRYGHEDRRGQNSHLNARPADEPRFETRDDAAALAAFGTRFLEDAARAEHSGPVTMPWIDDRWQLVDSFSGVQGLGIPFSSFPQIVGREYRYDPNANAYSTTYHLADLRHEPEADPVSG